MSDKVYLKSSFGYREDTKENWEAQNPVLERGEPAIVRDGIAGRWLKIGDGVTPFGALPWKIGPKGEQGIKGEKGDKGDAYILTDADKTEIADMAKPVIDQSYSPESENPQSGIAVAEAVRGKADVENWELLHDITLTEDVTNLTNLEVNSKKLYCEMLAQKPTGFSGSNTIHFQPVQRLGSYRGISCTSQYSSGGFIAFQGAMEIAPSGRINASGQIKDGEYGYSQNQMVSVLTQNYADDGLIKSVLFKTNGLGIGTTIKIWGVK